MSDYLTANWSYWDTIDGFLSKEIGWLWCGLEPPRHHSRAAPPPALPMAGYRILCAIKKAINAGQLPGMQLYPRSLLRTWAENHSDYRPRFLFPERYESINELSLETALTLIAALMRMNEKNKNWKPGEKLAWHGAIAGIVKAADSIGLQLDRNTIPKYLKEAENKIISA